jgi:glycosyltransferase involved in cell wall biosynthesis
MRSFSIIIPFKTGKQYLKACIESVFAQTHTQFHILVLTDNTSNEDGSLDYLHSLQHPSLEVIHSNQPLNILENWDRIKNINKDEYMTILGYDDLLHPSFLADINSLIDAHPSASLYHTHFNYMNKDGAHLFNCKPLPATLTSAEYLGMVLKDEVSIMATGYVFKTSDYLKIGGINIQYPNLIYADLQLWLELAEIGFLATSEKIAFSFRLHASTTKISKDKILMEALFVFIDYLKKISLESITYKTVILAQAGNYLEQTTKSIAHRLLRTSIVNREGMRINDFVNRLHNEANLLGVHYQPENIRSFRIAKIIEGNRILSKLFLLFKRMYRKPIY